MRIADECARDVASVEFKPVAVPFEVQSMTSFKVAY
jgi:hypothetical protein